MARKKKKILSKIEKKMLEAKKVFMNHGVITSVAAGIAEAKGLFGIKSGELVQITLKLKEGEVGLQRAYAIAFSLKKKRVGLVLLSASPKIMTGSKVSRTDRQMALHLKDSVKGTVINPIGQNLLKGDESRELSFTEKGKLVLLEGKAPGIMDRQPIFEPLFTGLTVVDGLVPIGRGQRELIIGDRQTGKTTLALDTILNQTTVVCVYVSIGQKLAGIAQLYSRFKRAGKTRNLIIVCATASDPAPLQYLAPYAGCAVAEYFRDYHGDATLVVYDDLTKHATAYRQMSLLLRRSPGREAFPGDVFYLHSRLLERAAKLADHKGGGSLTALPIVETQAGDVSAYIPTNVISITDGQIFLDVELFSEGIRPAVNVGLSVSRVGTAAQCPSMKGLSGNIKLELAQYREVLGYVKFGGDLDPATAKLLARGERLVSILTQAKHKPRDPELQVFLLAIGTLGLADDIGLEKMKSLFNLAAVIIDNLFERKDLRILITLFRYMRASELQPIVTLLLKYFFLKINRVNIKKIKKKEKNEKNEKKEKK